MPQIFEALGTPNDAMWAGVQRLSHYRDNFPQWQPKDWDALVPRLAADPLGADLLGSMLAYDPEARISAAQALRHPWFNELQASDIRADGSAAMQQDALASAPPPAGTSQPAAAAAAGGGGGGVQQPPAGPGVLGGRPVHMRSAFEQQLMLQQQQQLQAHLQLPRFQPPQQLLQMQQPSVFSFPPQLSMPAAAPPPRPPQQVAAAAAAAAAANAAAAAAAAAGLQAGCHPAAWARHQHAVPQHPPQPQHQQAAGHPSGVTPA